MGSSTRGARDPSKVDGRKVAKAMYHAIVNVPGYLPESEPVEFDSISSAWEWLAEERERDEDQFMDGEIDPDKDYSDVVTALWARAQADVPECGTVYGPTPGSDSEHDLGLAYCVTPVG